MSNLIFFVADHFENWLDDTAHSKQNSSIQTGCTPDSPFMFLNMSTIRTLMGKAMSEEIRPVRICCRVREMGPIRIV